MAPATALTPESGPVAVTGASGFVGTWVVRDLVQAGYTVRACVRDTANEDKTAHILALNDQGFSGAVQLWQADLNDVGSYDAPFAGCAGVVHTGAVISSAWGTVDEATGTVRERKYSPQDVYTGCFTEVKHLLDSFKKGEASRCVFTSSCAAVLHPNEDGKFAPGYIFNENDWCWDNNPEYQQVKRILDANDGIAGELQDPSNGSMAYCMAKASTEEYIYAEAEASGGAFECVSILPMHVIGPCMAANHDMAGTWQNCIRGMMEGKIHPKGWGPNGQMAWNIVDVRDTARLHRLCLEHPDVGNGDRFISAATDHSGLMATHELQALLAEQFPQLNIAGEQPRADGSYPSTPSIMETYSTKAIQKLGLKTRSIEDTVRATGEAYLKLGLIGSTIQKL